MNMNSLTQLMLQLICLPNSNYQLNPTYKSNFHHQNNVKNFSNFTPLYKN